MDLELKARSFIGQMGKGRDLEMKLFLGCAKEINSRGEKQCICWGGGKSLKDSFPFLWLFFSLSLLKYYACNLRLLWYDFFFFTWLIFLLPFNLFLLLFMGFIALFDTIYGCHYIISTNLYLYLCAFDCT